MRSQFRIPMAIILMVGLLLLVPGRGRLQGTPEVAQAASDPVIAAAGDIACDPASPAFNGGNGSATVCHQKYTSNILVNGNFAAVLPLGDVQYYCGGYQAFLSSYDLSWGRVKDISRPVVGNHEYLTTDGTDCTPANAGAAGYFNYFGAAAGEPGQGYYSYDIGDWHLIALNSNCTDAGGCGPTSPQGRWLAADLAANDKWCTLAYWHIPLFSSGGRAELNSRHLWQILYDHDVDLILNGHDHIYERFAPQTPDGIADPVRGIREFVVGTGGSNHTSLATIAANSEVRNTDTFGILKLTLHPTSYNWKFVPEAGKTFSDSGTQECHGSGTPPIPRTPTAMPSLTRTPTSIPSRTRTPTPIPSPTSTPTPAGANLHVTIGTDNKGDARILEGQAKLLRFPAVNGGPVLISSTNNTLAFGSERVIYKVNKVPVSFSEMMALPDNQLSKTYWLPWYSNNNDMDTQLRIANASNSTATVHVEIGGKKMKGSPFTIPEGGSTRLKFAGINGGPVQIASDVEIVASARVIYKVNKVPVSFSEMMALPDNQLSKTYWLPWYSNNKNQDAQLWVANTGSSTATVHVYVGGKEMKGSPFRLPKETSTRMRFARIRGGPVQIAGDVEIVASASVIYKINGVQTGFSEMMALPNNQLNTTYWLPWSNGKNFDAQLRIANVSSSTATIHIYIGRTEMEGSPFRLASGESLRTKLPKIDDGPVKITSDVKIVASQQVLYKVKDVPTSLWEMMALPNNQLNTEHWLPLYNSVDFNSQLRFAVP